MTGKYAKGAQVGIKKARSVGRDLGFGYMSLFILVLFFRNADAASAWVFEGLRLCAGRLIPSLFPFMVISSLIVTGGAGAIIAKAIGKPFGLLFGISGDGACAVVLGWLCGFPVGAKCAGELYDSMMIDETEYKKIICISSTPSPAFLIGTVGGTMLGSKLWGTALYAVSLVAALCVGIVLKMILPKNTDTPSARRAPSKKIPFPEAFTRAVADSATGMLCVCAFVVFFSAFLGALENALSFLDLSDTATALMFCFFELTSGVSRLSTLTSAATLPMIALAVGWSGLSVHFQTISICSGRGISFKPYFLTHLCRALICALIIAIIT